MWWAEHALPLFQERSRKWASSSSCSTLWSMTLATRDMCRNVMCSNWIFGITVESLLSLQSHQANWAIITSTEVGVKSWFGCSFCYYPLLLMCLCVAIITYYNILLHMTSTITYYWYSNRVYKWCNSGLLLLRISTDYRPLQKCRQN